MTLLFEFMSKLLCYRIYFFDIYLNKFKVFLFYLKILGFRAELEKILEFFSSRAQTFIIKARRAQAHPKVFIRA